VVGVESDGVAVTVGNEGVVAIGGEQRGPGIAELGAAHDESVLVAIRCLAHPGLAVQRVVNWRPGILDDLIDGPFDGRVLGMVIE